MQDSIDRDVSLELYVRMSRIRHFEERVAILKKEGELRGAVHLYVGQEAIASGVCCGLRVDDFITSTHRGHGHIIAKGGDLARCMAELFAKRDGYCKGKGGSMHLAHIGLGILGANGIVGGGIPIATGAALSAKLRESDQVSVAFFGDGAANQGTLHECLNLAAIWSLPVIFVCENNGYSELTAMRELTALGQVHQRAAGYGIPGYAVDGNDPLAVYARTLEAIDRARAGDGPMLIEAVTYRIREHAEGLDSIAPDDRPPNELEDWRQRDPLPSHRSALRRHGVADSELDHIDLQIRTEVDAAVEFARSSPLPTPPEAYEDVWADTGSQI